MMRFHSITIPTHTLFPVIGASCYQPTVTYLINDEAFGYLSRVIVTPAVDPRLIESLQRNDSEHWAEFTFSQHLLWPSEGYVSTRQEEGPQYSIKKPSTKELPQWWQVKCSLTGHNKGAQPNPKVQLLQPQTTSTINNTNPKIQVSTSTCQRIAPKHYALDIKHPKGSLLACRQSHSLSRGYGAILPTSLTCFFLLDQRLFTLETGCGCGKKTPTE
ncbi:hypothetical protein ADUPG1_005616, partial [Aduncisulcus paluster]